MSEGNSLAGLRVLVVEDDSLIAMLLEDSLVDLGCAVVGPAATVAGALSLADETPIDVALLDLNLRHGETSYGLVDTLAARAIPVAFVTGYDAGSLRQEYRGWPTLQKPFSSETLESLLARLAHKSE
jgi:CheY-like chemotaxis protein